MKQIVPSNIPLGLDHSSERKSSRLGFTHVPEAILLRNISKMSKEELFELEMNKRLPGYGWKVSGSFITTWSLIATIPDEKTDLEMNMVRMVAEEIFKEWGLSASDISWNPT